MIDFDDWIVKLGLSPRKKQPKVMEANLILLEGLYDLIIDLQKRFINPEGGVHEKI